MKFSVASMLPDELALASLEPVRVATAAGRGGGRGQGGAVVVTTGGKRYEGVIAARGGSEIEYDVKGLYGGLDAQVAIDDAFNGSLRMTVVGDGRELWSSDALTKASAPATLHVSIAGVKRLVLRSTSVGEETGGRAQPGGGPRMGAQAGWINARLLGLSVK